MSLVRQIAPPLPHRALRHSHCRAVCALTHDAPLAQTDAHLKGFQVLALYNAINKQDTYNSFSSYLRLSQRCESMTRLLCLRRCSMRKWCVAASSPVWLWSLMTCTFETFESSSLLSLFLFGFRRLVRGVVFGGLQLHLHRCDSLLQSLVRASSSKSCHRIVW